MKLLVFCVLLSLGMGCSSIYMEQSQSPLILFQQAQVEIVNGNTRKAISLLSDLEKKYIFSEKAIEADILLIWLYYQSNNFDEAETIASSFLKYFPYNRYTPWVEYIYSLILFQNIPYEKKNISKANEALKLFKDYTSKYPNSIYSKDLLFKMPLIKNVLANRVINIGKYYLKHKAYIGAISRFKEVIDLYSDSIFVPEALYRLTYSLLSIGLSKEALEYFKILELNYLDSVWYTKSKYLIYHTIPNHTNLE